MLAIVLIGATLLGSCSRGSTKAPPKSYDNTFEILEMIGTNKNGVIFAVRNCNDSFEKIMFCTSRFPNFYTINIYWANHNNDFFVLSHDTGVTPYIFKDGTWESWSFIDITKLQQDEYSAKLVKFDDDVEISVEYDINDIPKEVLDYLKEQIE